MRHTFETYNEYNSSEHLKSSVAECKVSVAQVKKQVYVLGICTFRDIDSFI